MQGPLAICARLSVLALALFACGTDDSTGPGDGGPTQPPIETTSRWSDPSSWPDGVVPAAGAAVTIPADKSMLLDVSTPALASLEIKGALVFDKQDLAITAGWIAVSGTLRIGTSGSPFTDNATITLTGPADAPEVMGMGSKFLGVLPGGTLDLHGETRRGWTRLSGDRAGRRIAAHARGCDRMASPAIVSSSHPPSSIPTAPKWASFRA